MAGLRLDEHDVAELTELLRLVGEDAGPVLPWSFLRRLKELIGCDAMAFNGQDSRRRRMYFGQTPEDGVDPDEFYTADECAAHAGDPDDDPFWRHYWDSPPCSYQEAAGDYRSVTLISDFYSQRQWHAHPMFLDCFREDGDHEHEMQLCIPDGPGRTARLLCFRAPGADFGERERFLLTLLRPHVAEAYRATLRRNSAAVLTSRQLANLELVAHGCTNRQVARELDMSEATVRTHLANIFTRLDVTSRTAAVAKALPAASLG